MKASSTQKFDILVPRASILLVSVSDRSLTLTKRIEALWTRMEIWGSRFMKLLHKFPYGGPYGPVMWRAFERKGKKKGRKCAFTHLGFFTRSAVMKSLACCEMGSKCFELNSYLTSVILRHVSSTVSPWKGDTPLRLQRKNNNCDKIFIQSIYSTMPNRKLFVTTEKTNHRVEMLNKTIINIITTLTWHR